MPEIRYPQYRAYSDQRIDANNAVMAFLAGSQLASHTLALTRGSQLLLPDVFPNVPHISRFSLTSELAMNVLTDAEAHLGAMAIPYLFAIHEDYIMSGVLGLLAAESSLVKPKDVRNTTIASMHELLESATSSSFTPEFLSLFHLLRLMRNSVIHAGGRASSELATRSQQTNATLDSAWRGITGVPKPVFNKGDVVTLTLPAVIATLATMKRLGREANRTLGTALPRRTWADILVADVLSTRDHLGNENQTFRVLRGVARVNYEAVALTTVDLREAARRASLIK